MTTAREHLESAIAALEAQRARLGDGVVDASVDALRGQLSALPRPNEDLAESAHLKHVSILFLDIVGSTALAQRLDPEEISEVMDDALARGTAVVEKHGGKVLQYAGDNILAVFGSDGAREDDAERAVRCGLGLLALGKTIGAEVHAAHGHSGFDVRVGIHTGRVLLGAGVDGDASIRGSSVNIAARLEQTAPAGSLRISQDVYAVVRGLFEVERQAPIAVKGVEEPVLSYLVLRAMQMAPAGGYRGIEGVTTRMVGREAEFEMLKAAFKTVTIDRHLRAITIVADAGIGKSRLLREFSAWCDARAERVLRFRGHATPQTQGQPFGFLRDLIARRFGIFDGDSVETARRKMEDAIVPFFGGEVPEHAQSHAHLLGHLIGIDWRESPHVRGILEDPKQIRDRAFHAAAQLFRRMANPKDSVVVVELEDLHWADSESLDFLTYLVEVDADVPLLIVACSRPDFFEHRSNWCAETVQQRIHLRPLGQDMSRELACELLKKLPQVPAALTELVIGGAEGIPFYMEEMIKMLIDRRALDTGDEWKLDAERLLLTKIPSTLTGLLQARLDSLPAPERRTLQHASVVGPVFWDRAVIALDTNARDSLPALVRRELALPRAGSNDGDLVEFAFKHHMLHQVTYETVLKRTKRELHGKVARWLAAEAGLRANDFLGLIANHFELAGDKASAAEYHARAAEYARTRMAHDVVLDHVQRALTILDGTQSAGTWQLRWRLLEAREATLDMKGDRASQREDLAAMTQLAEAHRDERCCAFAAWRRSSWAQRVADHAEMDVAARQAIEAASRAGDAGLRLRAQRMLAMSLAFRGRPAEGRAIAEKTLAESRELALGGVEGLCLNALGVIASLHNDEVGAMQFDRQSLEAYRVAGDRRNEAIARGNIGAGWLGLGELAQAGDELQEALRLMRANGERALAVSPLCALATLALWQGQNAEALVHARAAVDLAVAVRARDQEIAAWCRVGEAELACGRHDLAARAFRIAHARATELASPYRYDALAGLARVALAEADSEAAMKSLAALPTLDAAASEVDKALEGVEFPRLVEWTCCLVLAGAGDARSDRWLARAHNALMAQASQLSDAQLQQRFLSNIPHHRAIVIAWLQRAQ